MKPYVPSRNVVGVHRVVDGRAELVMNGYGLRTSLKPGIVPGRDQLPARWPEYLPVTRSFDDIW